MGRTLLEEEPEQFSAKRLVHPPLVYLWIPVGVISVVLFVLVVRICFKPRRTSQKQYDQELFDAFHDQFAMAPVPLPLEDDAPLPSRHLSRISASSETSEMSAHTATLGSTSLQGQLHRLQLSEIVNMLLTDTSSGHLTRQDFAPSASARQPQAESAETEASHARAMQPAYRANAQPGPSSSAAPQDGGSRHSIDQRAVHSPSASVTPRSDAPAGVTAEIQLSPFNDEFNQDMSPQPAAIQDGGSRAGSKWLTRSGKGHSRAESWSSPLHRAVVHRRTTSASLNQRTLSSGSDALTTYSAAAVPEDAALQSGSIYMGEDLEAQQ